VSLSSLIGDSERMARNDHATREPAALARHPIANETQARLVAELAKIFADANAAVAEGEGGPADLDWVCRDFEDAADDADAPPHASRRSRGRHRR
jgi:hypothetical protein